MDIIHTLLKKKLYLLPGLKAQMEMAPVGREKMMNLSLDYRKASILSLLYPSEDDWKMVFIKRTTREEDVHSGQISFPGGKMDEQDNTVIDCALREANEEINVKPEDVNIIRLLTPLKIPVSRFEVFPVLAYSMKRPTFIPEDSEVDSIIELSITKILDPINKKAQNIRLSNGIRIPNVPVFNFDGRVIWGATAMMLNELIEFINMK